MTIASFLIRYRRVLVLCAATAALHYAAIDWVSGRLGDRARQSPPPVMTALPEPEATLASDPQMDGLPPRGAPSQPASEPVTAPAVETPVAKPRKPRSPKAAAPAEPVADAPPAKSTRSRKASS